MAEPSVLPLIPSVNKPSSKVDLPNTDLNASGGIGTCQRGYPWMTVAPLLLLGLVTWQFEITAEDTVADCVLVVLIVGAVWWRWRR